MPKCYFQTTFMKPNNPSGKEPMPSLNVMEFLSSEYVVFRLSTAPTPPPRASMPCPQESSVPEAPLLILFAHGRHLKDSNPIFISFIFFMPITFYYIYLKHRAGKGSQCLLSSNFLPHQLLTELERGGEQVPVGAASEMAGSPMAALPCLQAFVSVACRVDRWDWVEFWFSRLL